MTVRTAIGTVPLEHAIGVAARLVDLHPHTLRHYEALGLVRPQRSPGNMRLFPPRHRTPAQNYATDPGVRHKPGEPTTKGAPGRTGPCGGLD